MVQIPRDIRGRVEPASLLVDALGWLPAEGREALGVEEVTVGHVHRAGREGGREGGKGGRTVVVVVVVHLTVRRHALEEEGDLLDRLHLSEKEKRREQKEIIA